MIKITYLSAFYIIINQNLSQTTTPMKHLKLIMLLILAQQLLAEPSNILNVLYDESIITNNNMLTTPKHSPHHTFISTIATSYQKIAALGFPLSLLVSALQFNHQKKIACHYKSQISSLQDLLQSTQPNKSTQPNNGVPVWALAFQKQPEDSSSAQLMPKQNIIQRAYNFIAKFGFPITCSFMLYMLYNTPSSTHTLPEKPL